MKSSHLLLVAHIGTRWISLWFRHGRHFRRSENNSDALGSESRAALKFPWPRLFTALSLVHCWEAGPLTDSDTKPRCSGSEFSTLTARWDQLWRQTLPLSWSRSSLAGWASVSRPWLPPCASRRSHLLLEGVIDLHRSAPDFSVRHLLAGVLDLLMGVHRIWVPGPASACRSRTSGTMRLATRSRSGRVVSSRAKPRNPVPIPRAGCSMRRLTRKNKEHSREKLPSRFQE
jgi:hypothetical protein